MHAVAKGPKLAQEHPLKNRKDGYAYHCEGFDANLKRTRVYYSLFIHTLARHS